jgi:hypothetical protein
MKKLLFVCLLLTSQLGYSAYLTEVKVTGEKIIGCGLNKDSVTSALIGTMRYNRINVTEKDGDVYLYHQVTALEIPGGCAVNVSIEFTMFENVFVKNLKKKIFSQVQLCGSNYLLTGPKYDMQVRVNDTAKDLAQKCLIQISKE